MSQNKHNSPTGPKISVEEMRRLKLPLGAELADTTMQTPNTLGFVRYYYKDRPFNCKKCCKAEVWTTASQRHWYEDCQGNIDAVAVLCRACRKPL
jgi:Probable zinc-ribbon domain